MAFLFMNDTVKYLCSCASQKPLNRLYFCHDCSKLKCDSCTLWQPESSYCSHCLKTKTFSQSFQTGDRCDVCKECPSCFHSLSLKATILGGLFSQVREKRYLFCHCCRWTSRNAGYLDGPMDNGVKEENILKLLHYYRDLAYKEMFFESCGGRETCTRRHHLNPALENAVGNSCLWERPSKLEPICVASSDVEESDNDLNDLIHQPLILDQVSYLDQRLNNPKHQAKATNNLLPQKKLLRSQFSLKCSECWHKLLQPPADPAKINFPLYQGAFNIVPELKLKELPSLKFGSESYCGFTLLNRAHYGVRVELLPLNDHCLATADLTLPFTNAFDLGENDFFADYEEYVPNDHEVLSGIILLKANKASILATVKPRQTDGCVKVVLKMSYNFLDADDKNGQLIPPEQNIFVNLGKL